MTLPAAVKTPGLANLVTVMPPLDSVGTVDVLVPVTLHGAKAQVFDGAVPVAVATLVALPADTSAAVTV